MGYDQEQPFDEGSTSSLTQLSTRKAGFAIVLLRAVLRELLLQARLEAFQQLCWFNDIPTHFEVGVPTQPFTISQTSTQMAVCI